MPPRELVVRFYAEVWNNRDESVARAILHPGIPLPRLPWSRAPRAGAAFFTTDGHQITELWVPGDIDAVKLQPGGNPEASF
jgi:hypothetical protein